MNEPHGLERLLDETRKAFEDSSRSRPEPEPRSELPVPGDVLVPERMKDSGVEWAVIACHPADEGRLFVVPADGGSMVGSADVEASAAASGGPWVLRCRQATWIPAERLTPWVRTGELASEDVERAWHRWWALAAEETVGSVLERETDEDPEYRRWIEEVVESARKTLESAPLAAFPAWRKWTLAAAAVLLVAAGGWIWRQAEQIRSLSAGLVNMDVLGLDSERSQGRDFEIHPAAKSVLIEVAFEPPRHLSEYRLELIDESSGETVWVSSSLVAMGAGKVRALLPASLLAPGGDRRVRLRGWDKQEWELVEDYLVHVSME